MTRALACQGYTLFFRVYASLSPIGNRPPERSRRNIITLFADGYLLIWFMTVDKLTNGLEL